MRTLARILLLAAVALGGCATELDDDTKEAIENVVTLQQGTISDLKAKRGQGPFRTYNVSPVRLLAAVETAARGMKGLGGLPVTAVFVSERRMEVVAKERAPEDQWDDSYSAPWRSAMVATVHRIPGEPERARLEIHDGHRGPFHQGRIQWRRDLPPLIRESLQKPAVVEGAETPADALESNE